ncbi:aminomethyltransferase [Thraustotheca clavata]|uniref:aminomethyltransferase n=1 Tax=Thraustotheca clavata TaxID=74557 RepID=A0A1V9ZK90_9STRA|nr:aminomethyltransferase [Thraustotheca clavata]
MLDQSLVILWFERMNCQRVLHRLRLSKKLASRRFNTAANNANNANATTEAIGAPAEQPGFFSRHPEYVFGALILALGGYIYRGSKNRKYFEAIQNEIDDQTPISPYEAYELRSQNEITPEVFEKVRVAARKFFPGNEATVHDFDLCLGSVLNGMQLKNLHHLERVLMSLPKNEAGKVNVDLLLVAFSLAVKGDVDQRLKCLYQLQVPQASSNKITRDQIESILDNTLTTFQIPAEKRVVAVDGKTYPFQEYAVGTANELLHAAVQSAIKDKTLPEEAPTQYTLEEFNLLMKSKSICIWGELGCLSTLSGRIRHGHLAIAHHLITSMLSSVPRRAFSSLKKTALYDLHTALGGKMVDFAGYAMPVQYPAGILKSHTHTRTAGCASLFDVSHMGQLRMTGKDRVRFLESIVVGDIQALTTGESKLSLITNDKGGIIDDCVTTSYDDHLYVVVNAGNQDIDWAHMQEHLAKFGGDVQLERIPDRSLVAIQGPGAAEIVSALVPASVNLADMNFMTGQFTRIFNTDVILTRCGYTGEDGFEISIPSSTAIDFTRKLLDDERVLEAGLGARDSLRLEAGLCLHGHDITPETTPIEGALAWTMSKRRREEGGFPGADIILDQLNNKTFTKKRIGFTVDGAPAREGTEIYNANGDHIGVVTSGTFSPTLKQALGMGYVSKGHFKIGTELHFKVRNKMQKGAVAKMPFVPAGYYKKD